MEYDRIQRREVEGRRQEERKRRKQGKMSNKRRGASFVIITRAYFKSSF